MGITLNRIQDPLSVFGMLLNHPKLSAAVVGTRGDFIEFNDAMVDLLGYPGRVLKNMSLKDVIGPPFPLFKDGLIDVDSYRYFHQEAFDSKGQSIWLDIFVLPIQTNGRALEQGALLFIRESRYSEEAVGKIWQRMVECMAAFNRLSSNLKPLPSSISNTERQICGHWKNGMSVKETAAALNISPKTVENHRSKVRKKLGVPSATDPMPYLKRFDTRIPTAVV